MLIRKSVSSAMFIKAFLLSEIFINLELLCLIFVLRNRQGMRLRYLRSAGLSDELSPFSSLKLISYI